MDQPTKTVTFDPKDYGNLQVALNQATSATASTDGVTKAALTVTDGNGNTTTEVYGVTFPAVTSAQ
ncbi:MAG: hypothetical protein KGL39_28855 [Patescibacteria group bacterium]|nr:hypothetical protein [Patescibacteria group bacterium]